MHCSNLSGRIYVEKTPKQCIINHHSSQRDREDAWWDKYSSGGLDDEQVYGQDSVKIDYIMWKLSQKWRSKNIVKEKK